MIDGSPVLCGVSEDEYAECSTCSQNVALRGMAKKKSPPGAWEKKAK